MKFHRLSPLILTAVLVTVTHFSFAQNVGIGITQPKAGLHIVNDNGLLATGTVGAGADLTEVGAGAKFIWHPKKSAFRVGSADNTSWNDSLIGYYSLAMGRYPIARGISSISIGEANAALKNYSVGIGQFNNVQSEYGVSVGNSNSIIGPFSFALGNNISSSLGLSSGSIGYNFMIGNGNHGTSDSSFSLGNGLLFYNFVGNMVMKSFVFGNESVVGGPYSFSFGNHSITLQDSAYSIGNYSQANNTNTFAFGNHSRASGLSSYAFGNFSYSSSGGINGFAIGNGAQVAGLNSISIGNSSSALAINIASGANSVCIGNNSKASGTSSFAFGNTVVASGDFSTAIGNYVNASGSGSLALGGYNNSSNINSVSIGSFNESSGPFSVAIGTQVIASGESSTAMGVFSSSAGHKYSFVLNGSSNASAPNLTANTSDYQMMMNFNDYIFWCNTPGKIVRFSSNGDICASGAVTANSVSCFSDIRLKKNINPLQNSLQQIGRLNGYHYQWIDSTQSQSLQTGLIAQEVKAVFPELVSENADGILSINYIGLFPHLLESVKTLKNENEELKKEIELIKRMISNK